MSVTKGPNAKCTVEDLSHLANPRWPSYGASMAGGNTLTAGHEDPGSVLSPGVGTESEQTAQNGILDGSDTPDLEPSGPGSKTHSESQGRYAAAAQVWKDI